MTEQEVKEKARQERNKYYREYRAKNKERIAEINRKYWERRARKQESEREGQ